VSERSGTPGGSNPRADQYAGDDAVATCAAKENAHARDFKVVPVHSAALRVREAPRTVAGAKSTPAPLRAVMHSIARSTYTVRIAGGRRSMLASTQRRIATAVRRPRIGVMA
jgi:hypothetical protein